MFDECVLELWQEMATRGRLINLISAFLHILFLALHYPALWTRQYMTCGNPTTFQGLLRHSLRTVHIR